MGHESKSTLPVLLAVSMLVLLTIAFATPKTAYAYALTGQHIESNIWYKTTSSFTVETRARARLAMVEWNQYLPEGQRVCYDSDYAVVLYYPFGDGKNVISKIVDGDYCLGQNTWRYDAVTNVTHESDININPEEAWWNDPPAGYHDPQSVLLHELGHTLGLDHPNNSATVMWWTIDPGVMKTSLHRDDKAGIAAIYG